LVLLKFTASSWISRFLDFWISKISNELGSIDLCAFLGAEIHESAQGAIMNAREMPSSPKVQFREFTMARTALLETSLQCCRCEDALRASEPWETAVGVTRKACAYAWPT
jgi:hypothetical protein